MEIRIIHFYPDLMSLYGSYANISVLRRMLEQLGNTVTVEFIRPGAAEPGLIDPDFIFMGAGTERSQKAALADFTRYNSAIKAAAENGVVMLFCGTAMELLGKSITDSDGQIHEGISLAEFTSVQSAKRLVEDVYGHTDLYPDAVVGFMNKSSTITGVETPLLTSVDFGFGNEGKNTAEGFHRNNVFASHLTGPILVKNPRLLEAVAAAIYAHRGEPLPEQWPVDTYAENGYAITEEQLKLRCQ